MLLRSNLRLLRAQLERLAETPYFSSRLDAYITELTRVVDALLNHLSAHPPSINIEIARFLADEIWRLTQFLTGSTTKQIPYEVVYAIERAASAWTTSDLLVTTAIVQESNFYFTGSNENFFSVVKQELGITLASRPVQIALPYIYRHKPLFCVPLFHELGHFVDVTNEVSTTSMLTHPESSGPDLPDLPTSADIAVASPEDQALIKRVVLAHRQEYFADLFSAAHVGTAASGFLQEFCPSNTAGSSHPSTAARLALMGDFLAGVANPIVDLFQSALVARGLPALARAFAPVSLTECFGNVRPFTPSSDAELFGLFQAGWTFLMEQWSTATGSWQRLAEDDRVRVANDLTEKSIRNRMLVEDWNAASHQI